MGPESAQNVPIRRAKCTVNRIVFSAASLGQLGTARPISHDGNVDERAGTTLQVASDGGPSHGSTVQIVSPHVSHVRDIAMVCGRAGGRAQAGPGEGDRW